MVKATKSSLKSALQAQQQRLKEKQKAAQAAQAAEQKQRHKAKAQGKGKGKATAPRQTIPFRSTDRVLLVGEGNFSFARALMQLYQDEAAGGNGGSSRSTFMPPTNITATTYDSEVECCTKYPGAKDIIQEISAAGVEVLFDVDGTKLEKVHGLKGRKWDKVVWNFPHAGKGITDQDRNIRSNQILLLGFLRSVAYVLSTGTIPKMQPAKKRNDDDNEADSDSTDMKRGANVQNHSEAFPVLSLRSDSTEPSTNTRGTVLITLRNVLPYTLWDLPRLAKKPPALAVRNSTPNPCFIQLRSFKFIRSTWPGYEHRMTKGERAYGNGKTGEGGEDRTWEFCLADP
ncbi:hypothetical protein AMATHDRAFT_149970 [Amanita thiersii Skay4041]|uniref:25S rRNA (uridine-N(3))-methyltransferase BMT5-like domain-containing protein n=1 Tax=Amanita thiersii Skay4041 TaxID=703135 RepID=A0A2A9NJC9_9AGAR|nr:hypothetical protein AMATHDRAFT_149970 [Amanita thiersii Skay4041]